MPYGIVSDLTSPPEWLCHRREGGTLDDTISSPLDAIHVPASHSLKVPRFAKGCGHLSQLKISVGSLACALTSVNGL
jgi:hypothetical protein